MSDVPKRDMAGRMSRIVDAQIAQDQLALGTHDQTHTAAEGCE